MMSSPTEANNSLTEAAPTPLIKSAPPRRALLHIGVLVLLALAATLLAFAPTLFSSPLAFALALFFIFLLPGYLGEQILFPGERELSLTRLPVFFVFALAIWALPATALQLAGGNWLAFRIAFVVMMWALTVVAIFRKTRVSGKVAGSEVAGSKVASSRVGESNGSGNRLYEVALGVLGVAAAIAVAVGPRNADDWTYLQVVQQLVASDRFQLLAASETRYSIRYAFHIWIFLQAYLGEWVRVDVVNLVREGLPVLVTPLALFSFYAWGRTFFGRANAAMLAMLAVLIQLAIYITFANGDGWGRGFFARSAQDKFLVWLIILPVAFAFAWKFLHEGKFTQWFAYGAALVAGLWVHPVSLFFVVLALAGFALFNLISRARLPRRRWLWLTLASLPALLSPVVIRATTLPAVFTIDTAEVEAYLRLSPERLLFQPPLYIADPRLVANPLILFSLVVLVLFAPRLRSDRRVQFLWGSTLLPLALLFNPWTAKLLGEMLTPWQLWRITWVIPAAFILTEGVRVAVGAVGWKRGTIELNSTAEHGAERKKQGDLPKEAGSIEWNSTAEHSPAGKKHGAMPEQGESEKRNSARTVLVASVLVLGVVMAFGLSNMKLDRSLDAFTQNHALPVHMEDMLRTLQGTLDKPANVLLPRNMTRYAPAYTPFAVVLSDSAQKPEDTRGQQIDRFYDPAADPKFLDAFLNFWEIEYAAVPNDSLQDGFLKTHPRAMFLYKNSGLTLYRVAR